MNKGINTTIKEFKGTITQEINDYLNQGVPIAVVELVLENLLMEVQEKTTAAIKAEEDKFAEEQAMMDSQTKWKDDQESEE